MAGSEDAVLVEQAPHLAHRLLVRHEHLPVELRHVEDRWDVALVERAQSHHRVARQRLSRRDDDVRERLAQTLAYAHQRAARAEARNDDVDAVERGSDLCTRPLVVRARVRLVRVLERHEVLRFPFGQLERQPDCAVRSLLAGGVDDLRAEEAEQALALLRRAFRHHAGERVALQLRHECERDAGVAARGLEELTSGLELARRLGRLDHRLRDAVLDRAGRVLSLELRVDADVADGTELDERRVADQPEDVHTYTVGHVLPSSW